ncbi:MAG TPA: alginate lyase family protein, partial [Planctomycetaceae bacterium]|nr:alginate lyase family protein [Planctomycetaceae bacterium]
MHDLVRYGRTLSHLRPSQVTWRLRYMVQRKIEALPWSPLQGFHFQLTQRPDVTLGDLLPMPRLPDWKPVSVDDAHAVLSELHTGQLTLLNEARPFAGNQDWCRPGSQIEHRLWNFSLHYHHWLAKLAYGAAQTADPAFGREIERWVRDWLDVCKPRASGMSQFPWNSFNIATRLQAWHKLWAAYPPDQWQDAALATRAVDGFAAQARSLSRHIEWDLRGNHLLRDASGLAVAARQIRHGEARRWMRLAKRIADSQSEEQILPDGGHFERSPMYHIHVLEDLVVLALLVDNHKLAGRLRETCGRMAEFVSWLRHPDGSLPLFNDAAQHAVCDPTRMLHLLDEFLGIPVPPAPQGLKHFADTGLVAWHGSPWTVFWDIGDIGPDYQPGHAHADTLTLECSVQGRRLIVDPGTHCYDHNEERRYDRSTAAHNTVCIDDTDSSEVWHIFRVGARANPLGVDVIPRRHGFSGWAEHNGYDALPGGPRHARQLLVDDHGPLKIIDRITGTGMHRVSGGYLLAPEWTAKPAPNGWQLTNGTTTVNVHIESTQPVALSIERRPWHPEYGVEIETNRLTWRIESSIPVEVTT